jgi:hypothetical protein
VVSAKGADTTTGAEDGMTRAAAATARTDWCRPHPPFMS